MAKKFMTSTEVCKYLDCSVSVLDRLERKGLLKPVRKLPTNKRRLYLQEDVDAYFDSIKSNAI